VWGVHGCCFEETVAISWYVSLEGMVVDCAGVPRRSREADNASLNRGDLKDGTFAGIFWDKRG
jgi:hypothetical protein